MRDQAPFWFDERAQAWIVTRYEDLRRIALDTKHFDNADSTETRRPLDITPEQLARQERMTNLFLEKGWLPTPASAGGGPAHDAWRALYEPTFRASSIQALNPDIEMLAHRLIDGLIDDGRCDWIKQFAVPLPLYVIGRLSGIGEEHLPKIREWTDAMISIGGLTNTKEEAHANLEKILECEHFVQGLIDKLRKEPDETLVSAIVNTEIPGQNRKFDDNELHGHILPELFTGGAETTRNAVAAGMKILIERKDIWQKLKSDPQQYMKAFIEELLRTEAPVQGLVKYAHKDTELGGVKIPKGSMVVTRYGAANYDERHFENPEMFDIERRNAGSHLTFGSGPHHCLGAPLARRELFWAFTSATERFGDVRFAEGKNDFAYHPSLLFRGLKELHIEFTPA